MKGLLIISVINKSPFIVILRKNISNPSVCPDNLFYEILGIRQFLVHDKGGENNNAKR